MGQVIFPCELSIRANETSDIGSIGGIIVMEAFKAYTSLHFLTLALLKTYQGIQDHPKGRCQSEQQQYVKSYVVVWYSS